MQTHLLQVHTIGQDVPSGETLTASKHGWLELPAEFEFLLDPNARQSPLYFLTTEAQRELKQLKGNVRSRDKAETIYTSDIGAQSGL